MGRRHFFRHGLRELLKPLAQTMLPLENVMSQLGAMEGRTGEISAMGAIDAARRFPLRPPGALPDKEFRDACSRCGECVRVCPVHCIVIDATGARGNGAPFIDATAEACILCDGLKCMSVCPSGALQLTPLVQIDMGTAKWNYETCLRKSGEDCRICIDHCPMGSTAIDLVANTVKVHADGCTGCGVCQHDCPTSPKSINVIPKAAR